MDTSDEALVFEPAMRLTDPTIDQIHDVLLDLWSEIGRPQSFGVKMTAEDGRWHSFVASATTNISMLVQQSVAAIGTPRVFDVSMAPVTAMYGSGPQIRLRLRAFALGAIDLLDLPVDADDFDLDDDIDALIDEFMGGS